VFDYTTLVHLGAQSCAQSTGSIEVALVTHGLNGRLATVVRVARKHPEFSEVVRLIEKTCARRRATRELDAMLDMEYQSALDFLKGGSSILCDVDFLALLAGMAGFTERSEEPRCNSARIPVSLLQKSPHALKGKSPHALLAMAMWFCDYDGYRDAVERLVTKTRIG